MKPVLRTFIPLLLLLLPLTGMAQQTKVQNLPNFDQRQYHFGFTLGYNSADLYMDPKENLGQVDSLIGVRNQRKPGFDLGIVSSLHLNKNISLRFLPSLSFQDRVLEYSFLEPDSSIELVSRRIGSTFVNFPLNVKFRTNRINNFAAYIITGAKYGIDMASDEDVDNQASNKIIVKLKRHDYAAQVGAGFDFFMKYFKFGIELKLSTGLRDLVIHEDTIFSRPIESGRTKLFLLSLTFEG